MKVEIKEFTFSKELLINLGNYSNIKIIASITATGDPQEAWLFVNQQLDRQENFEKISRVKEKNWQAVTDDKDIPF